MSGQTMSATTTASTITTQEVTSWRFCAVDLVPAEGEGVLGGCGGEFGEFSHDGFLVDEGVCDDGVAGPRRRPVPGGRMVRARYGHRGCRRTGRVGRWLGTGRRGRPGV